MNGQKRIFTINDISCFGKCSLTAAIPILSAAGIETCVLPTAVLSAHTGFSGYTFLDLTETLLPAAKHWKEMELAFDGIYTGYLGSEKQVSYVEQIVDMFPAKWVLVDPVMGDNGRLYDGFSPSFVSKMRKLLKKADVIVPNMTEAAFLADVPYEDGIHTTSYIARIAERLQALCPGKIILTGVHVDEDTIGTAVVEDAVNVIQTKKEEAAYSGTGDVFASAFFAACINGVKIYQAATLASLFVERCIKETKRTSGERHYGLNFEPCIKDLISMLDNACKNSK